VSPSQKISGKSSAVSLVCFLSDLDPVPRRVVDRFFIRWNFVTAGHSGLGLRERDTSQAGHHTVDLGLKLQTLTGKPRRREFADATQMGHLVMKQAVLQNMVTVVDSPAFSELYQSKADIADRPDLCQEEGEEAEADSDRKVVDLLVEQVCCAVYRSICMDPFVEVETDGNVVDLLASCARAATKRWIVPSVKRWCRHAC